VSTEEAAPPTSAVGPSFSKGQVNRAGRVLLGLTEAAAHRDYKNIAGRVDVAEVIIAFDDVRWYRALHARPLSNVAANLRYHVDSEDDGSASG
jgi:hypothetical protein